MVFAGIIVFGTGYALYNAVYNWGFVRSASDDPAGQDLKSMIATIIMFFCYFLYFCGIILIIVGIFSCGK